jgi:SPP1 family predicted phage head-tail adaptor
MKAGTLDRRITIQRKATTQSDSGQPVDTWAALVGSRWASVRPVRGDERFTAPQYAAKQQTEFQIRWSQDVADLTPLDRIIYPAGSSDLTAVFDILAVHESAARKGCASSPSAELTSDARSTRRLVARR